MIGRFKRAGLILPSLLTILGLAILIGLGSWQLVRKAEKEALIAMIEARHAGDPIGLAEVLGERGAEQADYQRVRVTGRFVAGKEQFYYAPQPRLGPGYDIYQPLAYARGKVVWVNRGYIPERERANGQTWQAGDEDVTIIGTARLPAIPGSFTPQNDAKANVWYWRDLEGMQKSAFAAGESVMAAPVFVVAEPEKRLSDVDKAHSGSGPWPKRGVSSLVVVNRHLEYALTWYGLAMTLIGVYLAFAWTRLRRVV
ncbi:MAG: SURF1 family protein [Alphaproteobacteria bacterium]|nr:SURF1 family protein [Alphaproteobacteria bacterium]